MVLVTVGSPGTSGFATPFCSPWMLDANEESIMARMDNWLAKVRRGRQQQRLFHTSGSHAYLGCVCLRL